MLPIYGVNDPVKILQQSRDFLRLDTHAMFKSGIRSKK